MSLRETFKLIEEQGKGQESQTQPQGEGVNQQPTQPQIPQPQIDAQQNQPQEMQQGVGQETSQDTNIFAEVFKEVFADDTQADPTTQLLRSLTQPQQAVTQAPIQQMSQIPQQQVNPLQQYSQYQQQEQQIPAQPDIMGVVQQSVNQALAPFLQQLQVQRIQMEVEELTKELPPEVLGKYGQQIIQAKQSNPHLTLKQLANLTIPRSEWEKLGALKLLQKLQGRINVNDINPHNNVNTARQTDINSGGGKVKDLGEATRIAFEEFMKKQGGF